MTERMRQFLDAAGIDIPSLRALKTGASGAHVWKCLRAGAPCVAKYTARAEVSEDIWQGSVREYGFLTGAKELDFLPEVLFARRDAETVLIVEPEYRPIAAHEWTDGLLADAMALCAKMHASAMPEILSAAGPEAQKEGWKSVDSLADWLHLAEKFPDTVGRDLLERICADFDAVPEKIRGLAIPEGLCHGDCHPENFLLDGGKMRLCDWQGAHAGAGVGDIAFFFSRGADMGVEMDEDALTETYLAALGREGASVSRQAFDMYCAASTLTVSFRFWAMFLQDASEARVREIYRPMAAAYARLFG